MFFFHTRARTHAHTPIGWNNEKTRDVAFKANDFPGITTFDRKRLASKIHFNNLNGYKEFLIKKKRKTSTFRLSLSLRKLIYERADISRHIRERE